MKKNLHQRHNNDRKKKTREEISRDHKMRSSVAFKKEQGPKDPTWDDLNGLHGACRNMLASVAPVSQLFINKELIDAMGDNVTNLRDHASILNRDVKEFVDALNQIAQQHQGMTGTIQDPTDLMTMLNIGEQYHKWTATYESVVLPTIRDIFALANSYLPEGKKINA